MRIVVLFDELVVPSGREEETGSRFEMEALVDRIVDTLHTMGHEAIPLCVSENLVVNVLVSECDLVFNLCESYRGEARGEAWIASQLEMANIPFTGAGSFCLALCQNKEKTKMLLKSVGIDTPRYQVWKSPDDVLQNSLAFPCIVKPIHEDASEGIDRDAVVYNEDVLRKRVEYILKKYQQPALVEEYIEGREINCAFLGSEGDIVGLPLSEIVFSEDFEGPHIVDYEAKWTKDSKRYQGTVGVCPADLEQSLYKKILDVAVKAYSVMELNDYGRVDIRLRDEEIFIIEVNPNPGINIDSGFIRAAKAQGLDFNDVLKTIIESSLKRLNVKPKPRKKRTSILSSKDIELFMVQYGDIRKIMQWFNDPEVTRFMDAPWERYDYETMVQSFLFEEKTGVDLVAVHKESQSMFGYCSIYRVDALEMLGEISYLIGEKDFSGLGLGKEMVAMLVQYAFSEMNLRRLEARVLPENAASVRCLLENGFRKVGVLRKSHFDGSVFHDEELYEVISE